MVLGYLLARAGVDVVVLEKHADFLRDFRGDTIHPSTLEVMHELGLLEEFLKRPHQEARQISGIIGDTEIPVADFTHLPTHCKFMAFMPQWDFLNFMAEEAKRYSGFRLLMQTEVTDLIEVDERVVGVRAIATTGRLEVHADLTVGADGRRSTVRERGGLEVENSGVPIDVLWMRLSRRADDPNQPLGRFNRGKVFVMLYRGDYWQCAFIIPKGQFEVVRNAGLEAFRQGIADVAPFLSDRVSELNDWDDVKLLSMAIDHLKQWYQPGLLCIGDAAHAMSPVGGVGINLAIQDAVATANILAGPLGAGTVTTEDLRQVQKRRELPARLIQRLQIFVHNRVLGRVMASDRKLTPPWPIKLLLWFPILRRFPARLIGIGFRPEHVRTPVVSD